MRKVLLLAGVGLICSEVSLAQYYKHNSHRNQRGYATYLNVGIGSGDAAKPESSSGVTAKYVGLPFGISVGVYDRENSLGAEFSFVQLRDYKLSSAGAEFGTIGESELMLSGLYHLRMNPTLEANVFAGFNRTSIKATSPAPVSSESNSANGIHYGVSAAYTINPNMAIFAKVFRLDALTIKSEKVKARDVILLGVQAEF
jgi:hypothetical protein